MDERSHVERVDEREHVEGPDFETHRLEATTGEGDEDTPDFELHHVERVEKVED